MNRNIIRLQLFFFGLFLVMSAAIVVVNYVWVAPGQECEQSGQWWDWRTRICARPILISNITGRVIHDDATRAAAKADLSGTRDRR